MYKGLMVLVTLFPIFVDAMTNNNKFLEKRFNALNARVWHILKNKNTITDGKLAGLSKGFERLYKQARTENNESLKNQLLLLQETFSKRLNNK